MKEQIVFRIIELDKRLVQYEKTYGHQGCLGGEKTKAMYDLMANTLKVNKQLFRGLSGKSIADLQLIQ